MMEVPKALAEQGWNLVSIGILESWNNGMLGIGLRLV